MFFGYGDPSIRYSGRFGVCGNTMTACATGSQIEIAFFGEDILLHFDIAGNEHPMPHLWINVDGGAMVEAPVDRYLRVRAIGEHQHVIKIILKGVKEAQSRFFHPLVGKLSFLGYEADRGGVLPEDARRTVQFVGDSITEGVLIDEHRRIEGNEEQNNRVYQDDVCATYGYIAAEMLGMRSIHVGYGATGVTRSGMGNAPKASELYPYCFDGCPIGYPDPDLVIVNHGANDRGRGAEAYLGCYSELLDVIRRVHPSSRIICLSAFSVVFPEELKDMIDDYNAKNGTDIRFIDSSGWIPKEPLHPDREGHRTVAINLVRELKKMGI